MLQFLQVLTVVLVAVAMGLSLAHALELPGKLRLGRDTYVRMQAVYYPGFTIGGGVGEFGGIVAALLLAIATPFGSLQFWLTLAGLTLLLAMHAVYWLFTHPVNRFWLSHTTLTAPAAGFFAADPLQQRQRAGDTHVLAWDALRDQWEYSHVARTVLAGLSLVSLVTAVSL